MIPGWTGSGPDHWQSRWERKLSTARRVQQRDWDRPVRAVWLERLIEEVEKAERPVVLVAHSIGIQLVGAAADQIADRVVGAFLVAPTDFDEHPLPDDIDVAFVAHREVPLPFRSVLIASTTDPYCGIAKAKAFAETWGSEFVDAGDAGHINTASDHGPWPDGLLRFAGFMGKLGT